MLVKTVNAGDHSPMLIIIVTHEKSFRSEYPCTRRQSRMNLGVNHIIIDKIGQFETK